MLIIIPVRLSNIHFKGHKGGAQTDKTREGNRHLPGAIVHIKINPLSGIIIHIGIGIVSVAVFCTIPMGRCVCGRPVFFDLMFVMRRWCFGFCPAAPIHPNTATRCSAGIYGQ